MRFKVVYFNIKTQNLQFVNLKCATYAQHIPLFLTFFVCCTLKGIIEALRIVEHFFDAVQKKLVSNSVGVEESAIMILHLKFYSSVTCIS